MKEGYRLHGNGVPQVVLIHGGPGAAGEMAPLGKLLWQRGISSIEPFQTEDSIDGQVEELAALLSRVEIEAVVLIGFSWGAWLAMLFADRYPEKVHKLLMVSTPPLTDEYAEKLQETRLSRLSDIEKMQLEAARQMLTDGSGDEKLLAFEKIGALLTELDTVARLEGGEADIEYDADIFLKVWSEAATLRSDGEIQKIFQRIRVPLVVIHGDYDSHPGESILNEEKELDEEYSYPEGELMYYQLPKCGHCPWRERFAIKRFIQIVESEIRLVLQ